MTPDELQNIIDSKKWRFAKSMPTIPHEYARRSEWGDDEQFNFIVGFIRAFGKREKFFKKEYTYLYLNGHKYWTMGSPITETILINRAKA